MNYVISIINPKALPVVTDIYERFGLPMTVVLLGRGTAVPGMLELLGIESTEKRIVFTIANAEKTKQIIEEQKRRIYIGVPGHGIVVSCPIKSIGGGSTVTYLNGDKKSAKYVPDIGYAYELIIAITNEGRTDMVMNAAREAGARGGTVLHGKGTGATSETKFLNVSIAQEKEIVLIVAKTEQKTAIMKSILMKAGPASEAGTVLFSLPTSEVAGFGMFDENGTADLG